MFGRLGGHFFTVESNSNRQKSGGTLCRLVADGIGDGPPKVGFDQQQPEVRNKTLQKWLY